MSFESEKREAAYLLGMIENGSHSVHDVRGRFEEADPALVAFIFGWLRSRYHAGHPASDGVLVRIVELCSASPTVARQARTGQADAIVQWFEEDHEYADYDREEFISLIVDKLEG